MKTFEEQKALAARVNFKESQKEVSEMGNVFEEFENLKQTIV